MHAAYARGDHKRARALARTLFASGNEQAQLAARQTLVKTEPDRIIEAVAVLGLGLVAWLVYNYVL